MYGPLHISLNTGGPPTGSCNAAEGFCDGGIALFAILDAISGAPPSNRGHDCSLTVSWEPNCWTAKSFTQWRLYSSSLNNGENTTTQSDHTALWATDLQLQNLLSRWVKGRSCTNTQTGL